MSGTSAVEAAARKGVAPALLRMPRPDTPFLSGRFTLAPWATISLTNSRLVSLPEPMGGGFAFFVVAAARLADPGNHVQRPVARSLVIRIGAGFHEHDRQLKMAVLDRQEQRTGSRLWGRGRRPSWAASRR